jgi:hypothetical protein
MVVLTFQKDQSTRTKDEFIRTIFAGKYIVLLCNYCRFWNKRGQKGRIITWILFEFSSAKVFIFYNYYKVRLDKIVRESIITYSICLSLHFIMAIENEDFCRAPDKLRICVFYAIKTSENACIIRSECTHYAYILLCKQTFQIRSVLTKLKLNTGC